MIYLDSNATTRVAPVVFEAMRPFLEEIYGNPSSAHSKGREVRGAVEQARGRVAALLGAAGADEIVFTSGGTESDNWAILGALESQPDKKHIVSTKVEHEAVRNLCEKLAGRSNSGYEITWLDVDEKGRLDLDQLKTSLRPDTAVVSIMAANNETGVLFPVNEAAEIVKENSGALFHADGVNAAGKISIDLTNSRIDLFSISGHKFHAPKGIGALYVRTGVSLPSLLIGGGQESGRRAGTDAVANIVALGAAAEFVRDMAPMGDVKKLRDRLESGILQSIPDTSVNGVNGATGESERLPNTSNISFAGLEGETILALLDEAGICVSTGSACNAEGHIASPVLKAMNVPYARAKGSIRFSLGRFNTEQEIEETLRVLPGVVEKLKSLTI